VNSGLVNTSGAFAIQQDFDNRYVISNLAFVKGLLELDDEKYSYAELSIDPSINEVDIIKNIQRKLGSDYLVQSRYEQNKSLYAVMRTEKWFIYIILSLILVVAAFNMIGALTMLVLEKKEDIKVLHALGADRSLIQNIFLSEGLLLALIGGGAGMLLALSLALLQVNFKLIPLQGGSFLIDYFPVKLDPADFLLVAVTVLVIALIAAFIPAHKAARQQLILREE
ncbi:MAG: ABC transporter permease, partial [Flavisolibacter sp.]|nr:ABC transporter permease [Flavisolibacter sp.]